MYLLYVSYANEHTSILFDYRNAFFFEKMKSWFQNIVEKSLRPLFFSIKSIRPPFFL